MGFFNSTIMSAVSQAQQKAGQSPQRSAAPQQYTKGSGPMGGGSYTATKTYRQPPPQQSSSGFFGPMINELRRQEGIASLPAGEQTAQSLDPQELMSKEQIIVQSQITGQRPQIVAQFAGWPPERIFAEFGA